MQPKDEVPRRPTLDEARREWEIDFLVAALDRNAGNFTAAAKEVGLDRVSLHRKARQLGVRVTIERVARITITSRGVK